MLPHRILLILKSDGVFVNHSHAPQRSLGTPSPSPFPQLNLHSARVHRNVQTTLPDARGTPPLRSLLHENAHPVKL